MDLVEKLRSLAEKARRVGGSLATEEATKNALVMPFVRDVLGYDIFNPDEVVPEFCADVGIKKGEKIDYALVHNGQIRMIIECKKYGETLARRSIGQLFRYFSVTDVRVAVLTNGEVWQFYTDLVAKNKMDEDPFLNLDLQRIDESIVPELAKMAKNGFDIDAVIDAAGSLKYIGLIKEAISGQFDDPDEDFVRFFTSKVYPGSKTAKVRKEFRRYVLTALRQFLHDRVNARLKSAIQTWEASDELEEESDEEETDGNVKKIETTLEEMEAFHIVRAILREHHDVTRIVMRDMKSYCGILLDDNNRKPICRLDFSGKTKCLITLDSNKKGTRNRIDTLDDLYSYAGVLIETVKQYDS